MAAAGLGPRSSSTPPPRHVATHLPPDSEIRRLREEIEIHRHYNTPHLTKREKSWIRAWFELIRSGGPCSIPTHHAVTLHAWNCPAAFVLPTQVGEHCTVFDPRLPEAVETACRDQLNNPVTLDSFHSTSRKHYRQHNDVFVPSTWFGGHYQSGAPPCSAMVATDLAKTQTPHATLPPHNG